MSGFLWGAILGGGVVFLLGTKRGKKLLKKVTEEGLEGISQIEELVEEGNDEEKATEQHSNGELKNHESVVGKITKSTKRLFKGIQKRK